MIRRGTPTTAQDRNYPADNAHANGNYHHRCFRCGCEFVGHKRRRTCRACMEGVGVTPIAGLVHDVMHSLTRHRDR